MMSALKYRLIGLVFILLSVFALPEVSAQGASETACPRRQSNEICIQVIAYGRNPGNGRCCVFPNPCSVPPGWEVFFTPEACEAAQ